MAPDSVMSVTVLVHAITWTAIISVTMVVYVTGPECARRRAPLLIVVV